MGTALYRITLRRAKKPVMAMSRLVSEDCPDSAVLCAQQWCVWSHAEGRGGRTKHGWYRVETRQSDGTWSTVVEGSLADARKAWKKEDDARIDGQADIRPLIGQQGTTRNVRARSLRGEKRPKSRLATLVAGMQQQRK